MNKFIVFFKNFFAKVFNTTKQTVVIVNLKFVQLVGSEKANAFKKEAISILKTDLGKIVLSVVAGIKAVGSNLSNDDKRKEALAQILALAKTQGVTATESIVNLFIELAVTALNNKI
jgi:hypothetical protein